jgi:plasmid stabilization system protein ParE
MQVVFSRQAEIDLEEIGDFIAADNPHRAVTFVREIRNQCLRISQSPLAYVARPPVGTIFWPRSDPTSVAQPRAPWLSGHRGTNFGTTAARPLSVRRGQAGSTA